MSHKPDNLRRHREIVFCTLHPDPDQAGTASALLDSVEGLDSVKKNAPHSIQVSYLITQLCLADIEALLIAHGFHLDNSLVHRMRRALVHYVEETQRANMGCDRGDSNCTTKVFINRYRKREHGCQDERPQHWRRYL